MLRHPALTAVGSSRVAPRPLVQAGLERQAERVRGWWRRRRRAGVAAGYERIVAVAERPVAGAFSAAVPVRRVAVRSVRPELRAVAALLRSRRALPAAGVRAARRLLCDGCGPLYAEGDLGVAVRTVLALLEGPR